MEARGGNGYIEDWVNPRLIRDAQVGLLWEGTSNINALDVITRAVGKSGAHLALQAMPAGSTGKSLPCRHPFAPPWPALWTVPSPWPVTGRRNRPQETLARPGSDCAV